MTPSADAERERRTESERNPLIRKDEGVRMRLRDKDKTVCSPEVAADGATIATM
jgi:hypothetical protein